MSLAGGHPGSRPAKASTHQHARFLWPPFTCSPLGAPGARLGSRIDDAVARVLDHCQFILGPEVGEFERDLAAFCGARHAVGVASGFDALVLALLAQGIGRGDAVFCPAFTFWATAEAAALVGATPVFVDVEETTFNIDSLSLERAIATAKRLALAPSAVLPVDLFGLPADYDAIAVVAEGLFIIADAAQSFGATYKGRGVGTLAPATTTSFFPAKPLGCYGDGGAVLTDDPALADVLRSLRVHGQGSTRQDHVRVGLTGRLDTIQAAVLIEKLKIFAEEIGARNAAAQRYHRGLADVAVVPSVPPDRSSVWAQYTVRLGADRRDHVAAELKAQGIPTASYYPKPLHRQAAAQHFPQVDGGLPVTDRVAREVLSLPMHAYLDAATQERIVAAVRRALA
jgi:dTDP-4-amino-4,6-dideoxygalactose transaminase